jgi:hypothetical protein
MARVRALATLDGVSDKALMRRLLLLPALLLAGCGSPGESMQEITGSSGLMEASPVDAQAASSAAATPAAPEAPPAVQARSSPPPPGAAPGTPPGTPLLAYAYSYRIEAPARQAPALAARHEQACVAAGPAVCQVINAQSQTLGDEISGELSFRATPAYVQRFRSNLRSDVEKASGELRDSSVATEDLTRSIVDAEAGLRARRLLQTRLEQLIASRPGNLQQLLEIERELARVQGEIDATQSNLEVMRSRVRMSTVTLSYHAPGAAMSGRALGPLEEAGRDFLANVAGSLALMLNLLSLLLPWLLLGAAGIAAATAWRRRRRSKSPAALMRPEPGQTPSA